MFVKPLFIAAFFTAVLAASAQQQPYGGTAWPVPGTVQAEDYDTGGEGVAYHDTDAANQGGRYRTGEGVDVEDCGEGGYNVGYVQTGEYVEYTIDVAAAGAYTIRFRAAAQDNEGRFRITVNNQTVRSSVTVPVTGNWQVYAWVDVPDVELAAGTAVLRFTALAPSYNINYFTFVPAGPPPPPLETLPGSPSFSVPHGFYASPFDLTVWSDSANAVIRYTLDGSDPRTSLNARETESPAVIRVDPASTDGRGLTPAVVVRALAVSSGGTPITQTGGQTYIFPERVRTQADPRGDWPFYPVNGRQFDYNMDPDVVNDARYRDLIDGALRSIPVLCVATDPGSLFNPDSGIYVNPTGHGIEWERASSIECVDPRGLEPGFQINGGLRIRGGWSRQASGTDQQLKLAFRFFFRNEYGKGKLDYPLFQDEGVSSFDGVDLRTSQNYSWSMKDYSGHICTFIRDVFSRDCQRDMGQPYTRTRPYHLFLNGMYWGLYETQERSEASFAESYFGGDRDDYDVIKVARQMGLAYEATDGTVDAYQSLWSLARAGFKTNAAYFKAMGQNADGSVNWSYPVYVDPDNLIDYLLVIYYAGNFDAPVSAWGGNEYPNNIYCIYNRLGRQGFLYFCHDSEHTLMDQRYSEHSDYGYDRTGPYPGGSRDTFNPQWLHQRLSENAEYRLQFADRVYRHFFNHGALTRDASRARFAARAAAIDMAIIAESARWGDAKVHPPRTKDEDWQPAVDWVMDTFFSDRTGVVLGQLKNDNLYPDIDPPVFSSGGTDILDDGVNLPPGSPVRLKNPNTAGKGIIYYTLDGSDPRQIGGAVNPAASNGGDDATATISGNCMLKARVLNGTVWSAMHELAVNAGQGITGLALTEIHYHPMGEGTEDDREFEFLELKNTGSSAITLTGAAFVRGVDYAFPAGATLTPGAFFVLASNAQYFRNRYGFDPSGEYTGQLDNGGERIALVDAAADTVIDVRYNDKSPWPVEADGMGYSLVPGNPSAAGDPSQPEYWASSKYMGGSPGADDWTADVASRPGAVPVDFTLESNFPNPFNASTQIVFFLPMASVIRVTVVDAAGRRLETLADGKYQAGRHSLVWNAEDYPSGVYFCRLTAADIHKTRKMILIR
jgi:hypothetical protein